MPEFERFNFLSKWGRHPDVEDVRSENGFLKTFQRHSLERINNSNPDSSLVLHLDRVPSFLTKFLHRFHLLVLNTAQHWIKAKFIANGWIIHVNRKPIKEGILMDMTNVKNYMVHRIVKWLDLQLPFHPGLKAFFRTRSPRHLDKTGFCNNTIPLMRGSKVFQEDQVTKLLKQQLKARESRFWT
ncbi:Trichome birefringence-like 15 isoform 1 [Hibiscus syriacus]|uniref:Trichome birefringence-like 15 isoform 1 n=1 Tax=Hibiscus syriacus TaxID=106335 RepID=A0A6A2ZI34_HIBSY|nr:Trichome birefringence-like 15 isoform 1 [Hibiscus syriacus]